MSDQDRTRGLRGRLRDAWRVVVDGLASARYTALDILHFLGRGPQAIGRAIKRAWFSVPVFVRRRLAVGVLAVALLAALGFGLAAIAPCWAPGGESCPPDDDAIGLVPADAIAYAHANLDADTDQAQEVGEIVDRLPTLSAQLPGLAPGALGLSFDYERQIAPWSGGEIALALLPGGPALDQLLLLEAADAAGADEFAERTIGPAEPVSYEGTELALGEAGVAAARFEGFLAIGPAGAVRGAIDVARAGAPSLSEEEAAEQAREELPDARLADAYLSEVGARELVGGRESPLSSLEPFVNAGATESVAASLQAEQGALELAIRSALNPDRADRSPGFFGSFEPFSARLPESLPADALAYLGLGEPAEGAAELVARAEADAPGLAAGIRGLAGDLRRGDVDLEGELVPLLGEEAALVLLPAGASEPDAGAVAGGVPIVALVADGVDAERANAALARLQGPIAEALDVGAAGTAPIFREREIDGTQARSLRISPTVDLTYAIIDETLVIATDSSAVAAFAEGGLGDSDPYENATEDFPPTPVAQVFLDLAGLVELGELAGLAEDPAYAVFSEDARALQAVGAAISEQDSTLQTDLRLLLG